RRNLRGYRDVHVRSNALFAHFPPGGERVLCSEHVGTPTRAERGGFMPFTDAAYWIATKGGRFEIANIEDVTAWALAYQELTDRIASGDVEIIGRGSGIGTPVKIAGYKFSNIGIDYPFTDTLDEMLFGKVPHVRCYLVRDLEHWQKEFNDKLFGSDERVPEYTHLEVSKADVARLWPHWALAKTELRAGRNAQIERFKLDQHSKRRWFSFSEIAEECSKDGTIKPNEDLRSRAYMNLLDALLIGDFDIRSRTQVLFLNPELYTWPVRIKKEYMKSQIEIHGREGENIVRAVLSHCWIPRDLCSRWFQMNRLQAPVGWFEPLERAATMA